MAKLVFDSRPDINIWLFIHSVCQCVLFLHPAKIGTVSEVWNSSFWFLFVDGTCPTRDWCSVLLVDFRGTDPPPCDVRTGQDSRWRLQYDVYQYFLPEDDLTEEGLLKHLQRMAEVPQVTANAIKVSLILLICVARLRHFCKSWVGEKLPGAYFFTVHLVFLGFSFDSLLFHNLGSLFWWYSKVMLAFEKMHVNYVLVAATDMNWLSCDTDGSGC